MFNQSIGDGSEVVLMVTGHKTKLLPLSKQEFNRFLQNIPIVNHNSKVLSDFSHLGLSKSSN